MNTPETCPACLAELPDGYPFDHVAVDRALRGDRVLFKRMRRPEKTETVRTGVARGMSLQDIAGVLEWRLYALQALVPDLSIRADQQARQAAEEAGVRELWQQGVADIYISVALGFSPYKVHRIRARLGLPTLKPVHRRTRFNAPSHQAASLLQPTEASIPA